MNLRIPSDNFGSLHIPSDNFGSLHISLQIPSFPWECITSYQKQSRFNWIPIAIPIGFPRIPWVQQYSPLFGLRLTSGSLKMNIRISNMIPFGSLLIPSVKIVQVWIPLHAERIHSDFLGSTIVHCLWLRLISGSLGMNIRIPSNSSYPFGSLRITSDPFRSLPITSYSYGSKIVRFESLCMPKEFPRIPCWVQ